MTTITNQILKLLNDDMVSHGLLVQCIEEVKSTYELQKLCVNDVLEELLLSEKVEIGIAKIATSNYVEFIAWKGTVGERVSRAIETIHTVSDTDREFAYWLCLRKNVDRFEEE